MCDKKPKMSHIKKLECNQGGDLKIFIECCNADPEEIFLNTTLMEWTFIYLRNEVVRL